jgi:hypothetical protein
VNFHFGSWNPKWTPESSKNDYKGQNPSAQKVIYIIKKLLKLRCLKWARIWTSETQVMAKRKVGSQIGNLTLDH